MSFPHRASFLMTKLRCMAQYERWTKRRARAYVLQGERATTRDLSFRGEVASLAMTSS
jgi:hypothetical protein